MQRVQMQRVGTAVVAPTKLATRRIAMLRGQMSGLDMEQKACSPMKPCGACGTCAKVSLNAPKKECGLCGMTGHQLTSCPKISQMVCTKLE